MKRFFTLLLAAVLAASAAGCVAQKDPTLPDDPSVAPTVTAPAPTQPGDPSGKYELDSARGEAIVDDFGVITAANDGNARVYYQIFVGSFSDSNGDGIGDLRGIIERFDYLNDGDPNSGLSLGVEGIWLSPIFLSPSYHKYDCADYYQIDPQFGTMDDLRELIELCHARDVQIILDLVINHTSPDCAWFRSFRAAHQDYNDSDPYYDFYTWSYEPLSGKTCYALGSTGHYYEGNFSAEMPELNYDNPAVMQAMVDVAKFYLDMGVDGFRFDAAKYIYYGDAQDNADFWVRYMQELRQIKPDIYTVAEVWDADNATYPYITSTNCFNFSMSQVSGQIASAAKASSAVSYLSYIRSYLDNILQRNENAMLISFISNHDMDRAAGYLMPSTGQAQVAANLSILTPGSPFIYYGEEIGMLGSRGSASTDANRRLAMLWGDGDTVKDPVGANYKAEQINGTVADQLGNGNSLYNHYKKLIAIRKANPEIAYGEMSVVTFSGTNAAGFCSTWNGSTVCVIHNTATEAITVDISALEISGESVTAVGMGGAKLSGTTLTIDAQTSVVLR